MSVVAIVKGMNAVETTVKALELIGSEVDRVLSAKKPILIKPNFINSSLPSTGITTDARVVDGVITFLKARGVDEIVVGEGTGYADTFHAFSVAGIDAVA